MTDRDGPRLRSDRHSVDQPRTPLGASGNSNDDNDHQPAGSPLFRSVQVASPARTSSPLFHATHGLPTHLAKKQGHQRSISVKRWVPVLLISQLAIGIFYLAFMRGQPRVERGAGAGLIDGRQDLEVRAIAADTGGWNALEPVLSEAVRHGAEVSVHFSGASARAFLNGRLDVSPRLSITVEASDAALQGAKASRNAKWTRGTVKDFVMQVHDVTIVATSASLEGIGGAVDALCSSAARQSLAILEDMYRVSGGSLAGVSRRCPERVAAMRMCVPDPVSERLALTSEPGRTAVKMGLQVSLCGGPQFDTTAILASDKVAFTQHRNELRRKLGISHSTMLVLAVGQVHGTAAMTSLLVDGIASATAERSVVEGGVVSLLRMHPRADTIDRQRALAIKEEHLSVFPPALESAAEGLGPSVTSEDLLPAADIVISGHSTVNYHAILWGMPGVVYLGTQEEEEQMRSEKGLTVQPEAEVGAAWRASTPGEFAGILAILSRDEAGGKKVQELQEAQRNLARANDGHAAVRAWRYFVARQDR